MYQPEIGIEEMKALAESGDGHAAFDLGWRYYLGNSVAQDKSQARHWYSEAASRGVTEARDILQVLEAEARRMSELESLIQQEMANLHRYHHPRWIAVLFLVVVMATIATVYFISRRETTTADNPDHSQPASGASQYIPVASQATMEPEETTVPIHDEENEELGTREVIESPALELPEQSDSHKNIAGSPSVVMEPNGQASISRSQNSGDNKGWDFNDILRIAQDWLKESENQNSANAPTNNGAGDPEQ